MPVFRTVDGEKTTTMGFIYDCSNEVKENIGKNLDREVFFYKEIWDIIDQMKENQMQRHACAYFLNPLIRWRGDV